MIMMYLMINLPQRNRGYQELAEGAMARARARLMGYEQGAVMFR
jgi:hypothetical protein